MGAWIKAMYAEPKISLVWWTRSPTLVLSASTETPHRFDVPNADKVIDTFGLRGYPVDLLDDPRIVGLPVKSGVAVRIRCCVIVSGMIETSNDPPWIRLMYGAADRPSSRAAHSIRHGPRSSTFTSAWNGLRVKPEALTTRSV